MDEFVYYYNNESFSWRPICHPLRIDDGKLSELMDIKPRAAGEMREKVQNCENNIDDY